MKVVILSITPYKEKDAIVEAISEKGDITFSVKGILDPKSKNASLNNPLTVAEIETREGNYKYPVLKSSSVIESPMKVTNDLYYLSSLMLIAEVTKSLLQDEEKELIFNSLVQAVISLKTADKPWAILLSYIAQVFAVTGYEFEVSQCVFCGTRQGIVTFSFNDGGFVCQNCMNEETTRDLTKTQMLLVRSAFNSKDIAKAVFDVEENDALVVLNKFFEFIKDSYGVNLHCSSLFNK